MTELAPTDPTDPTDQTDQTDQTGPPNAADLDAADVTGSPGAAAPVPAADPADGTDAAWSTGDARVDDAVSRLDRLDERDLHEHVELYDSVHRDLADVLDDAGTPSQSA